MVRVAGLKRRIATGIAVRAATRADARARCSRTISAGAARAACARTPRVFARRRAPGAGRATASSIVRWDELDRRRAASRCSELFTRPDLPGAHAARRRPGAPVPLHLRAVAQPRRRACATRRPATSTSPGSRCRRCCRRFVAASASQRFVPLEDVIARAPRPPVPRHGGAASTTPSGSPATRTSRSRRTTPRTSSRRSRRSCCAAGSARRCGSRSRRRSTPHVLDLLVARARRRRARRSSGCPAPLDLRGLNVIADLDRADLQYAAVRARRPPPTCAEVESANGPPTSSRRSASSDVLLHHPYDSFSTSVQAFLEQAAADPHVLAIKQTLYRTSGDSPDRRRPHRRRRGRQAGARARRDQGPLRRAGQHLAGPASSSRPACHVVYGLVGLKTHCKLSPRRARRRPSGCAATATSAPATTTPRPPGSTRTSACSPPTRRSARTSPTCSTSSPATRIEHRRTSGCSSRPHSVRTGPARADRARDRPTTATGRPRGIRIKVNSIVDEALIDALYRASQAGVPVDLLGARHLRAAARRARAVARTSGALDPRPLPRALPGLLVRRTAATRGAGSAAPT